MNVVLVFVLVCMLSALAGCGEAPQPPEALRLATWTLAPRPTLIVGGDEPGSTPLYRVSGAARISGGLLVVNGGAAELRHYSEDGDLLGRVGREGSGPGEFRTPVMVGRLPADSLVVYDRRNARLSIVCDGSAVCSEGRVDGDGRVVGVGRTHVVLERILYGSPPSSGVHRNGHEYIAVSRETDERQPLATFAGQPSQRASEGAGTYAMPVLMTRPPQVAVLPDAVVVANGTDPELHLIDFAGAALGTIPLPIQVMEVSDEEFEAAVADDIGSGEGWDALALAAMRAMRPPERRAPTRSVLADRTSMVWVELEEGPPDARRWLVVDPRGTVRAEVFTPGNLSILEIGEDYLLGLRRDALGVEYVESYPLDRGGGSGTLGVRRED